MDLDLAQLRALQVAVAEGTFEAAARVLHVTPSAISQRIRGLEIATGRALLVRSKPIRVTRAGEPVLRLARQIAILTDAAAHELSIEARHAALPIAVNSDSLATWVLPALAPLGEVVAVDIHREDQAHTHTLLRDGTVMAAITTQAEPVPGCIAEFLGVMTYRPMAAPSFVERWFPDGPRPVDFSRAPVVVFDRKDALQHTYLRKRAGENADPPMHFVPASAEFVTAVCLGMGWGMVPDLQARERPGLVVLDPEGTIDVRLYWQQWRLQSASLDRAAAAIREAAGRLLRPAGG